MTLSDHAFIKIICSLLSKSKANFQNLDFRSSTLTGF